MNLRQEAELNVHEVVLPPFHLLVLRRLVMTSRVMSTLVSGNPETVIKLTQSSAQSYQGSA